MKTNETKRIVALEAAIDDLRRQIAHLHSIIRVLAPTASVSIAKSMKTTVIQVLNWSLRRGLTQEEAAQAALDRLKERGFDGKDASDITEYIRVNAARIFAEATEEGWTPAPEPEQPESSKTATMGGNDES